MGAEAISNSRTLFDALKDNPQWRRLYFARSASLLGNWLNTLAIVHLLGKGQDHAALSLAGVFILKQVPVTLLGPVAGVVADRLDRRAIMILCDLLSAAVVVGFLFASPEGSLAYIYLLTLLQISVTTFFDPAYRAVTPDLVRKEDLLSANAISSLTWSATFAAGTALGGVLLYSLGWQAAIVADILSYLVSAVLIAGLRDAPTRPPARVKALHATLGEASGWNDLVEGARYLTRPGPVRGLLWAKPVWGTMLAATLFLTLLGMEPTHRVAGSTDLGVSFLWLCRASGTGVGPLLARRYARDEAPRVRRTIAAGFVVALASYASLGFIELWWLSGLTVFIAHIGGSTIWVMSTVLLQQQVPSELRGRTFAAELGLVMLTSSLSHLVYAGLIDFGILRLRTAITAAAAVSAVLAAWWIARVVMASPSQFASPSRSDADASVTDLKSDA